MRKKAGKAFIIIGAVLLIAALCLLVYNSVESERAKLNSTQITNEIVEEINNAPAANPYSDKMTEKKIGNYYYIGYLTIPSLKLDLPVMSSWSYKQLKLSPCRYSGSTKTDNLVIAAHNYTSYFAKIKNLTPGDKVYFTDMDGVKTSYKTVETDTLSPTEVSEMTNSGFDLTLFTCTYSGNARVAVRCEKISE